MFVIAYIEAYPRMGRGYKSKPSAARTSIPFPEFILHRLIYIVLLLIDFSPLLSFFI